jgi:hypothetical protein
MRKPQARVHTRGYWESISDDTLLGLDLVTDDPESLPNLVQKVPAGDEETYVEFKYDLRNSGREEEFICVHGSHQHLAGFVMRKGNARFLVGWMCGASIYGEDFDQFKADFDFAVNRQETLRRRREIEKETVPFMAWLEQASSSNIFKLYQSVRQQVRYRLPWIWENAPRATHFGVTVHRVAMPQTLFGEDTDPQSEFGRVVAEMSALAANLISKEEIRQESVDGIKRALRSMIRRIEEIFASLREVEQFFQPAVLQMMCELANEFDNPKKRKYIAGLGSITCKRDRDKITVQMPANYRLPNSNGLEALKEALRVL